MSNIIVTELAIYPVKSLGQILLTSSAVEVFGLQNDRRWMVIDSQQHMLTQRTHAKMCLIQVNLLPDGIQLIAPEIESLQIERPDDRLKIEVTVWLNTCTAYDAGDTAANWLSEFLGVACRLVYFPDDEIRTVDLMYAERGDKTAFSDGFPILLTSTSSLKDLNDKMDQPISMQRFRPNIVISESIAYAEDTWKRIKIGELTLRIVKPCSRCVIPSIDPCTAERGKEPTRALVQHRKKDNKVYFGQNLIPDIATNSSGDAHSFATLNVGMQVEVLE